MIKHLLNNEAKLRSCVAEIRCNVIMIYVFQLEHVLYISGKAKMVYNGRICLARNEREPTCYTKIEQVIGVSHYSLQFISYNVLSLYIYLYDSLVVVCFSHTFTKYWIEQ